MMNTVGGYELGKVYWNGYWQQFHKIIALDNNTGDWRGWNVVSLWQDGHITEHCTAIDESRDRQATEDEWKRVYKKLG